jgi:uncharacterized membrane protein
MNDIGWVSAHGAHEEAQMRRFAAPDYEKEQEKHWREYFSPEQIQRRDEQRRRQTRHNLLIFIFVLGLPVWLWLVGLLLNHFTSLGTAASG